MARALLLLAVVLGWATAAGAGSLAVYTTDPANNPKTLFSVGETILLKVTGDSEGGVDNAIGGQLFWNGALTTTVVDPPGCTGSPVAPCTSLAQGNWLPDKGQMFPSDGTFYAFNQTSLPQQGANNQVDTSFITLLADLPGVSQITWGGTVLDFFGVYSYSSLGIDIPTGHSFTITPEPETAVLIALGLLGPALAGRAGRRQKRTSRSSD